MIKKLVDLVDLVNINTNIDINTSKKYYDFKNINNIIKISDKINENTFLSIDMKINI
jgi:hypothetical protein